MTPLTNTTSSPTDQPAELAATQQLTERSKLKMLFLNATACYVSTYLLVTLVLQGAEAFLARQARVPGYWWLNGVHFTMGDGGWKKDAVLDVYGVGPVLVLVLGLVALLVFLRRQQYRRGLLKIWLLWLVFQCINGVFGGLLADTITQSGSWYVPNWMIGLGTWPSTVFSLLLVAAQLGIGFVMGIPFLLAQDSRTILRYERRATLVQVIILGPWLAGSVIIALSRLPGLSINEMVRLVTMGMLLGPLALSVLPEHISRPMPRSSPTRTAWGLLLLTVVVLLTWRIVLRLPIALW